MVNTQLKILRVFGPTGAEVSSVLRGIRDDGCPGLRLLERDGEFAICVQVSAPNRAMAEQYCDKWAARLRTKFGDDVFAEGETSLAQATLDALLEKRKLLVAVDEPTGRLLGSLLQPLPHSEAVFDFGTESYADPQKSRRITVPEQLLRRFPGDIVQAAAGRALAALQVTGADYAAAYMPASVGQCPFVLVCDRRGAVACALPPDMNDTFIGNQILDLLRNLKDKINSSIMLITHDLGVIAEMADYVVVMYAGRVVEKGTAQEIFANPAHPYTIGLMASKPMVGKKVDKLYSIPGKVPNPINMPNYCYFKDRCEMCVEGCQGEYPHMIQLSPTHMVSCYRYYGKEDAQNG